MKKYSLIFIALVLLAAVSPATTQQGKDKKAKSAAGMHSPAHTMVTPDEIKWGPGPPALPAGAQMAVLEGDPSKAGAIFTVRAKFPDGYKVPPHWHPTDENVTVLQGTLLMGLSDKLDPAAAHEMTAGSFATMPKGVRHFAMAKGETLIQIHAMGPFEVTYVNPADDPRKQGQK